MCPYCPRCFAPQLHGRSAHFRWQTGRRRLRRPDSVCELWEVSCPQVDSALTKGCSSSRRSRSSRNQRNHTKETNSPRKPKNLTNPKPTGENQTKQKHQPAAKRRKQNTRTPKSRAKWRTDENSALHKARWEGPQWQAGQAGHTTTNKQVMKDEHETTRSFVHAQAKTKLQPYQRPAGWPPTQNETIKTRQV